MPTDSKKQVLKVIKERRYLNKDYDSFRADLLDYARTYFPDAIKDFSEAGLGGLLLDFSAYVGDVQSYYLDHQFQENFPELASEPNNIERHLNNAGVPVVGASPAVAELTFYVKIPATGSNPPVPDVQAIPIIGAGSSAVSQNGIEFQLTENIDFTETDASGRLVADIVVGNRDSNNNPVNFILSKTGIAISGFEASETFSVGQFEPFKKVTLSNENITEITKVMDTQGNDYYEVEYLTQDTVYRAIKNFSSDNRLVEDNLLPTPAPYRFIKKTDLNSRLTSLTFGGASAETLNDDIIPDPSEFSLPLYGKKIFSRYTLNPGNLLQSTTFGVLTPNTTLTVQYRYGGGLKHNVEANAIRNISRLEIAFPGDPPAPVTQQVRASVDVNNLKRASGGEEAPTIDELKAKIPAFKAAQSRIVTKEDLLSRVYTLPSNFGRVYRASIQPNPNNPLASRLFIVCRNQQQQLIIAPDTLKKNLATYLNEYRMISDAIDILDARIIDLQVKFSIVTDPTMNRQLVLRNVIQRVKDYFNIKNFEIDQPLVLADIQNIIYNNPGVVSVVSVNVENIYGNVGTRTYSTEQFDVPANTFRGIISGPPGSIFQVHFKDYDIIGTAV